MHKKTLLGLALPTALLAAWQLGSASGVLDPLFFPAPTDLVRAAVRLLKSGELLEQLRITLFRMLAGFALGAVSGLLFGVAMGASKPVRHTLEPLVSALFTTPKLSLLPMLMLFLGIGEPARVLLIAASCFVLLALHSMDAVRNINPGFIDMAKNYGAGRAALFHKVYVPATMPQIFTGLRLAAARALLITVAVELLNCPDGVGSMIWISWQTFSTEKLYVAVLVTAALGAGLHASLRHLESVVVPWKNT